MLMVLFFFLVVIVLGCFCVVGFFSGVLLLSDFCVRVFGFGFGVCLLVGGAFGAVGVQVCLCRDWFGVCVGCLGGCWCGFVCVCCGLW